MDVSGKALDLGINFGGDRQGVRRGLPGAHQRPLRISTVQHQLRNMALLLRPSMLDDLGLVPAVGIGTAREVSRRQRGHPT